MDQLKTTINDVNIFTDLEQCKQFLNTIKDEKAFVIISESLGQHLVQNIHAMPQIDAIYIFCANESSDKQWTKEWSKIKGVHTEIKSICEALKGAVKQCNQDSAAVSFVPKNEETSIEDLNKLEPTFMYTQTLKKILLEMKHDKKTVNDFAAYCRQFYTDNKAELNIINEFENDYKPQFAIRWYTRECFISQMLNRALRLLEADTIISMGFYIRDLHDQIKQLYEKQTSSSYENFIVYRGQGLSETDFEKLQKIKEGLMSFNNFLSVSKQREVSLGFAKDALSKTKMIGILFKMTIDPSVPCGPYAAIQKVSYFGTKEEFLFSMSTVFRIVGIKQIDNNNRRLYQVDLKPTADNDKELRKLTKHIEEKAITSDAGWERLGNLLLKMGQFDKAQELYEALLQTSDDGDKKDYYNQLGCVKNGQGDYEKAIWYHEKAIEIKEKTLPSNDPSLATSYNNIGLACDNMGENSKALSFYEKAIEIGEKTLSSNNPDLATYYNNIAGAYENMKNYSRALSCLERCLEIYENSLPPDHPKIQNTKKGIEIVKNKL